MLDMTEGQTSAFIDHAVRQSGKSNDDIAHAMGFSRPNLVTMLRVGATRLPLDRIPDFAAATGADAYELLTLALAEYGGPGPQGLESLERKPIESNVNIRAPIEVCDRFKALCMQERRTQGQMLELLLTVWGAGQDVDETR
ncbi:hypothetical protein GCM10022290_34590 [Sagittula marina]